MKRIRFGNRKWLALAITTSLISALVYASVTYLMGSLVDNAIGKNLDKMFETGKIIALVVSVTLLLNSLDAFVQTRFRQKAMVGMKRYYIDHLLKLEITQVQQDNVPVMLSQLTNDFDRYEAKFVEKLSELIGSLSQFIASTILLGSIHPMLVVGALAMLVIFAFVSKGASKPIKETEDKKTKSLNKYTAFINETFLGFEVIKQHQLESYREAEFMKHATQVQIDNYHVDRKSTHVEAFNGFMINLVLYTIVIGGMVFAKRANLSLGSVIVIFSAFSSILWPIRSITPLVSDMTGIGSVLEDMDKTLMVRVENRSCDVDHFHQLVFDHADLGYDDGTILSDVSLEVNEGEKVLIIGPSGAGKSTILKTLRQSIAPVAGRVTMNDTPIGEIKVMDYYSKFSIVDQIGFLFDGSVKDNITLYQDYDDVRVQTILNNIGLGDLGLQSQVVNDGNNLSGGQRARIMLARALCLNADIVMCDEIFASLDLHIAKDIEHDFLNFNNTVINVSHIMFEEHLPRYDRIYIVDKGQVYLAKTIDEVRARMLDYIQRNQDAVEDIEG